MQNNLEFIGRARNQKLIVKPMVHKTRRTPVLEIKMFDKNGGKKRMVYAGRRCVRRQDLRGSFTTPIRTRKTHDGVSSINLYREASCKQRRKQTDGRRMIDNRSRNAGASHVGIRKPAGVLRVPNGRTTRIKMDTSGHTHTHIRVYVYVIRTMSVFRTILVFMFGLSTVVCTRVYRPNTGP